MTVRGCAAFCLAAALLPMSCSRPATSVGAEKPIAGQRVGSAVAVDNSRRFDELLSEAIRLEDQGLFDQAIDKHFEILRFRPREVRSMNTIAGLKGKLNLFDEELTWVDRALAVDSRFAPAWVNRGNALGSLGKLEEADAAFIQALELDSRLPEAHNGRGVVADGRGSFEEAVRHYRAAVEVDPRFEDGWFSMAAALANMRRFDEATIVLKRVLALNPNAEDARAMLLQIEADSTGQSDGPGR